MLRKELRTAQPGDHAVAARVRGRVSRPGIGSAPLLAAFIAVALLANWHALATLASGPWESLGYSHGYLVALVCIWLILEQRHHIVPDARDAALGLAGLSLSVTVGLAARFAFIDLVAQLAFVFAAVAAALAWFGRAGARRLLFPIAFFLTAIPIWDWLTPVLQLLTVGANRLALSVFGIPAFVQGNLVTVPAGTFEIAGGCSGLHFFVVAVAVGALYAYLNELPTRRALAVTGLAALLSLVANWVRVFVIIVRGEMTAMRTSLIQDHYWFGWILFAVALAIFFLLATRFKGCATARPSAPDGGHTHSRWTGVFAATFLAASGAAYAGYRAPERAVDVGDGRLVPVAIPGWVTGPTSALQGWHTGFGGPTREHTGVFQSEAGDVIWTHVTYATQRAGAKLIGFGSSPSPTDWPVLADADRAAPDGIGTASWRTRVVRDPAGAQWVLAYWYTVGDAASPNSIRVKLLLGAQVFTPRTAAGANVIASRCDEGCDAALNRIEAFAAALARARRFD